MIRDITLGQYYPGSSWVHRLDPRVKIIASLLFIVELFLVDSYWGFLFAGAIILLIVGISRVPLSFIFRGLKPILFILIFTMLLNIFMTPGEILFKFWFLKATKEGLNIACFMAIRIALLILGTSLLTLTTKPLSLTDGIERLLSPLTKIGLPAHEIAMMMSIALRFIPTLLEETDKIMKAQEARGADFETGNLIKKAKSLIPILVPLFVSAFRIASDLAMAMEARCYRGGVGRTRMHEMKLRGKDFLAMGLMAVFFAGILVIRGLI